MNEAGRGVSTESGPAQSFGVAQAEGPRMEAAQGRAPCYSMSPGFEAVRHLLSGRPLRRPRRHAGAADGEAEAAARRIAPGGTQLRGLLERYRPRPDRTLPDCFEY